MTESIRNARRISRWDIFLICLFIAWTLRAFFATYGISVDMFVDREEIDVLIANYFQSLVERDAENAQKYLVPDPESGDITLEDTKGWLEFHAFGQLDTQVRNVRFYPKWSGTRFSAKTRLYYKTGSCHDVNVDLRHVSQVWRVSNFTLRQFYEPCPD